MENLLVGLVGGLLALDTTAAFQILISQPLVACTIIGWLLGDIQLGLQIGAYLQLLWLCSLPVGAAIIPEGNVAAMIITALVIKNNADMQNFHIVFVCTTFYGIIISYLGGELVVLLRKNNVNILHHALNVAEDGKMAVVGRSTILALLIQYIAMFLLIMIMLFIGDHICSYVLTIPNSWDIYFKYGLISILGIGAGLILPMFKEKNYKFVIFIGIIIGCLVFIL